MLVQLAALDILLDWRCPPVLADAVALLPSTQVNFVLSYLFTWRDRRPLPGTPHRILGRWAAYQGSAGCAALLNVAFFVVARTHLHAPVASALGIAVAALANFVAGDRVVFRARGADALEHIVHDPRGRLSIPPSPPRRREAIDDAGQVVGDEQGAVRGDENADRPPPYRAPV